MSQPIKVDFGQSSWSVSLGQSSWSVSSGQSSWRVLSGQSSWSLSLGQSSWGVSSEMVVILAFQSTCNKELKLVQTEWVRYHLALQAEQSGQYFSEFFHGILTHRNISIQIYSF